MAAGWPASVLRPAGQHLGHLVQHPLVNGHQQARLFSHVNEIGWQGQAHAGALPAHQGFCTGQCHVVQAEFGLQEQAQLTLQQRIRQAVVGVEQAVVFFAHAGQVCQHAPASAGFGCVHGRVGVAQQQFNRVAIVGKHGQAHRQARLVTVYRGQVQWLLHGMQQLVGQRQGGIAAGLRQQHHKLVATQAGHGVLFAHVGPQPLGNADQQCIAHAMSHRVVHGFEVVDVRKQQAEWLTLAFGLRQQLVQAVGQQRPVGQGRERVDVRQSNHFAFSAQQARDVGLHRHVARQTAVVGMQGRDGAHDRVVLPGGMPVGQLALPAPGFFQAEPHVLVDVRTLSPRPEHGRFTAHHRAG